MPLLICSVFVLTCVLIVSGWPRPHSIFGWPCASLSLVSNCVPVLEIIVRCLSPDWRLSFLYIGVLLTCRSLLLFVLFFSLFSFLCFCGFLFLQIRKSKRSKSAYGLPITSNWQPMRFILFLWPESSDMFNPIYSVSKFTWKSIGLYS